MPGENEDRFRKIRAELEQMHLPELPIEDLEAKKDAIAQLPSALPEVPKLEDIRSDAWKVKEQRESQRIETKRRQDSEQKSSRGLGVGLVVAYMIVGFPMVGVGIGWVLDTQLKANVYKGLGALIGSTVGVAVALVYISRTNQNS